jgi:hypothetical protein
LFWWRGKWLWCPQFCPNCSFGRVRQRMYVLTPSPQTIFFLY